MDAYHIALEEGSVSYLDTQAPYFDGGSGTQEQQTQAMDSVKNILIPASASRKFIRP